MCGLSVGRCVLGACAPSWLGGKGVHPALCRASRAPRLLRLLLPMLSCAEVDCKKAQFFWLFKVRAQSSPSVQSARLRQCVPPHTRATVASAWISILSRIGANIFGFCGLSYILTGCWEMLRNCFLKLSVIYLYFGATHED